VSTGEKFRLTRSDVWLLVSIVIAGELAPLSRVLSSAGYLMRQELTFDEVSYGVPRLIAQGLVEVDGADNALRLSPRPKATALLKPGVGQIEAMFALMDELDCRPWPEQESENRSLGRLPQLSDWA
jgi:hypothetical protein